MHPLTRTAVTIAAASLLVSGGAGPSFAAQACASGEETENNASTKHGVSLSLVDNSNADSWLEVDRTANSNDGPGSAGSDHDGHAVGGGKVIEQS